MTAPVSGRANGSASRQGVVTRIPHVAVAVAVVSIFSLAEAVAGQVPASRPEAAPALRADSMLSSQALRADVAILRRACETLHPGLYRYNTPGQMDEAFRALEREFDRDRTLAEAYLAFSVFAARVKCGHTYPSFFNQAKAVALALFRAGRVPFHFRWLGSRMIVTRSYSDDPRIAAGTEVLAINGVAVADILARLLTVARADGNNDAKRVAYLEVQATGGNQRGINGGAFFFLRLPGSGIELDLPLIGQFPDGDRPDAGLDPDIPVVPTVNDIAAGRDAEMEAALAAIRRANAERRTTDREPAPL